MQKNDFEGEESCTDWGGTEKHHRKLERKGEGEIENTPEEDSYTRQRDTILQQRRQN